MTYLRKAMLIAGAAAAIMITALNQTSFAQSNGGDPSQSLTEPRAAPDAAPTAANKKADDAMTAAPSAPQTYANEQAAAAMEMGSSPGPAK